MAKKTPASKGTAKKVTKSRSAGKPSNNGQKPAAKARTKVAAKGTKPAATAAKSRATAAATAELPRLTKTTLSRKELNEFREALLAKRRTLVGDMSGMEAEAFRSNRQEGSGDLSTMPVHMADIGTDNYEQEFTLGLLESERQLLREINEALSRIDNGTYGICLGTGQPISPARLRAKPWARYCIEYARMIEQGLVRPANASYAAGGEEDEDAADEHLEEEVEDEEHEDHEEHEEHERHDDDDDDDLSM